MIRRPGRRSGAVRSRTFVPVEPVGYGVNNSFRELMVQVHDTVPHTVNIVTAGNPPGQPIEVALEAGKTVSFMMPEKLYMTPMPFLNGGTHTTGSGLNFRAGPIAQRLATNPDVSQAFNSQIHGDPYTPTAACLCGRHDGVPSAAYADERDDDLDPCPVIPS